MKLPNFFRTWKDLYHAIKDAQKFIYITGWSIYTKINLVRGDDDPGKAS
jgi:phospholipase D1/2